MWLYIIFLVCYNIIIIKAHKIVETSYGVNISVYERDDKISHLISNQLEYKSYYLKEIEKFSTNKGYFLDIGCHVGWLSFYALSKGMKVICFEPLKYNLDMLVNSLDINPQYENDFFIFESGLSDKLEDKNLSSYINNIGNPYVEYTNTKRNSRKILDNVRLAPLDSFITTLPKFDLISIDVNGYEPKILEGGRKFFKSHIHVPILMNFSPSMIKKQKLDSYKFLLELQKYYRYMLIFNSNREIISLQDTKKLKKLISADVEIQIKLYN